MPPPAIKIRIGAALDASLDRAFQTAVQKAQRAEKAAQRAKKQTTTEAQREVKAQLKAQEALHKAAESLDRQRARGLMQQFRAQERAAQQAARAAIRETERRHAAERREIEKTTRLAQRAFEREARARDVANRAAARARSRELDRFATRTSHRTTRFLMPEAPLSSMATRALSGVSRGLGVDFSTQGAVSRIVELERRAQDLANSGYQAGQEGPNGTRVAATELVAQARAVGQPLGVDAIEVLSGLEEFQKITGDLATGRSLLQEMTVLTKATGSNAAEMAAAYANVSNGLGDIPNKSEVISRVMRTIAGQGKLGAVEISDMATQMARVAASASSFAGDAGENIQKMGALAQIARAEGGAPSAAEASRSVVGFANTMKKSARINEFKAAGINVFTDETQTKLKDPLALIRESLVATGGDLQAMNKLFMDVVGARAIFGLQKRFVGAGGGEAGLAAIDEYVDRMLKAQLSDEEVKESARRSSQTMSARAMKFQNDLDSVTERVMGKLAPALEKAAPAILNFAGVIGDVTTWAIDNPKMAIGAAITASLARAGIESAFRAGIERAILAATPGALPGAVRVGGAGVATASGAIPPVAGAGGAAAGGAVAAGLFASLLALDQFSKLNRELGGKESLNPFANKKGEVGIDQFLGTWLDTATFGAFGDPEKDQSMQRRGGKAIVNVLQGLFGDRQEIVAGDDYDKRFPDARKRMAAELAAMAQTPAQQQMVEQTAQSAREQAERLQQSISVQQQMLEQLQIIANKEVPPGDEPPDGRVQQ